MTGRYGEDSYHGDLRDLSGLAPVAAPRTAQCTAPWAIPGDSAHRLTRDCQPMFTINPLGRWFDSIDCCPWNATSGRLHHMQARVLPTPALQ